ncbi:sialomucin core protein 24 [Bombina bombina]|uniref:sialomucin core protein 24 n=1 Tax=Bombina bombina TaxID=8345 RepID=UPI00235A8861|nr:sialomucin core protein 24 [Bombina bombina]
MNTRLATGGGLLRVLVPGALLLLLLGKITVTVAADTCGEFETCDTCTTNISSGLQCAWVECSNASGPSCINETLISESNCTKVNCSAASTTTQTITTVVSTTANATGQNTTDTPPPPTANSTATASTTNSTNTTPVIPTTPSPKKGTFDAASFIGGIVLVLGLQAVIFFIYKFCKAKDRNYHTL